MAVGKERGDVPVRAYEGRQERCERANNMIDQDYLDATRELTPVLILVPWSWGRLGIAMCRCGA